MMFLLSTLFKVASEKPCICTPSISYEPGLLIIVGVPSIPDVSALKQLSQLTVTISGLIFCIECPETGE